MKKRIFVAVLALAMVFMLCGCCLKHDFAPATCTEPETCSKCGKTQGESLGHKEEAAAAVEATCTETGLTEGVVCSVCGEVLTAQEEVPALGHSWTEATCTEPKTCSVCGETEGEALGHTEETVAAVEATCTETGLTEGVVCSVCGEVLTAQEEIPALGHKWTEATMSEPKTCSVCGETEGKAICDEAAVIINGTEYSTGYMNYAGNAAFLSFLNSYGSYAAYLGLDPTADPAEQECPVREEGGTWKDYFVDTVVDTLSVNRGFLDYAAENGIALTEEETRQIRDYVDAYETTLAEYGYESFDDAIAGVYGPYAKKEFLVSDALDDAVAQRAYSAKHAEIVENLTEEETAAFPRVDVRHILIQASPEEDGTTFSQEALDRAKYRAEAILRIFERGEMTEESFAALAQEYSEDPGSASNGGLYEAVEPGMMVEKFNEFCFDESRQPGDTAIVYGTNGAYAGYHVMYFVGNNAAASIESAAEEKLFAWFNDLSAATTVEKTEFIDQVVLVPVTVE